jgi:hypothetical protein
MAIDSLDKLVNGLGNKSQRLVIDKASIGNAIAGGFFSLWRATGQPAQGDIPTTSAICNSNLLGSFSWSNPDPGEFTYMGYVNLVSSLSAQNPEFHDRVAHMGGLLLDTTTPQSVGNFNLETLGVHSDRIGASDYSELQWWLEAYLQGGATASNAVINVTYNDNSTGDLLPQAVGGTLRPGRMLPLNALVPASEGGKYIKGINSVQLSASTGVAGNFGFTVTRPRASCPLNVANKSESFDWVQLGFSLIPNDACLMIIMLASATTTGLLRGGAKLPQG